MANRLRYIPIPNSERTPFWLRQLFQRFQGKILLTFGLLFVENALNVVQPFIFGLAINDLLAQSMRGALWIVVLYICKLLVAFGRRLYDTRAYAEIYSAVATETIQQQMARHAPLSAIAARSNLLKELIDFFELDLTEGFTAFISVMGAILMLLILNGPLFVGCLVVTVLIYLIFQRSERRTFRLNRDLNNELEKHVDWVSLAAMVDIRQHFGRLNRYRVKLSDLEARNFGLSELLLFVLIMVALFVAASGDRPSPGSIFAVLSYVFEFAEGIYVLPLIFQQLIRINEISQRLVRA